jgi:hypothetical protein
MMLKFARCRLTNRRWLHLGENLAIGFGPTHFIERVWTRQRGLVYARRSAL